MDTSQIWWICVPVYGHPPAKLNQTKADKNKTYQMKTKENKTQPNLNQNPNQNYIVSFQNFLGWNVCSLSLSQLLCRVSIIIKPSSFTLFLPRLGRHTPNAQQGSWTAGHTISTNLLAAPCLVHPKMERVFPCCTDTLLTHDQHSVLEALRHVLQSFSWPVSLWLFCSRALPDPMDRFCICFWTSWDSHLLIFSKSLCIRSISLHSLYV